MKNIELQNLEVALKKCQELETGIAIDKVRLAECAAERIALESDLDVADRRALTRVAQLQVLANLAPQRMEAQQTRLEGARQELVAAGHEFVRAQLRPRCMKLRSMAEERVRKALETQYSSAHNLKQAVSGSTELTTLRRIEAQTIISGTRTDDCEGRALKILQAWSEAEAFEKAHLN